MDMQRVQVNKETFNINEWIVIVLIICTISMTWAAGERSTLSKYYYLIIISGDDLYWIPYHMWSGDK